MTRSRPEPFAPATPHMTGNTSADVDWGVERSFRRSRDLRAHLARYCALLPSVNAVATVRIWLRDHLRRTGTGLSSRRMVQSRMRGCRLAATGRATPKRRRSVLSFRDGSAMAIIIVP